MKNFYLVSVFFDVPILAENMLEAELLAKIMTVDIPEKSLFSAYKTINQSDEIKMLAVNYDK